MFWVEEPFSDPALVLYVEVFDVLNMYVRLEVLLRFAFREQTEEELTTNKRARPTPQPPRRRCSTRLHFKRRCCGMFEGLLEIFPTLLGDDILNHL